MQKLLSAILDDDRRSVERLLKADPGLATSLITDPKLYQGKIFHWMYVGDTALHLAAAGHRAGIVMVLLESGADPNSARNMRRSSPLLYAADGCPGGPVWDPKKQVETIRRLLEGGADLHWQDKNGASALHRAVRTRSAAAVRFLLEAGSDALLRNKPGSTPFHLAVQNTGRGGSGRPAAVDAQREIIAEFLARGVSPRLKDGQGKTVADSARSPWIREMLDGRPV